MLAIEAGASKELHELSAMGFGCQKRQKEAAQLINRIGRGIVTKMGTEEVTNVRVNLISLRRATSSWFSFDWAAICLFFFVNDDYEDSTRDEQTDPNRFNQFLKPVAETKNEKKIED